FFKGGFRYSVSFALTQLGELAGTVIVTLTYQGFRLRHSEFCQRQQDANTFVFVFGRPIAQQIAASDNRAGVGVSGLQRQFKPFETLSLVNLLTSLAQPVNPCELSHGIGILLLARGVVVPVESLRRIRCSQFVSYDKDSRYDIEP